MGVDFCEKRIKFFDEFADRPQGFLEKPYSKLWYIVVRHNDMCVYDL